MKLKKAKAVYTGLTPEREDTGENDGRETAFDLQQKPGDFEGRPECDQNHLPVSSGTLIIYAASGARSPAHPRLHRGQRNKEELAEETHIPLM